ncbi:MAG: type II toxin-antitoxin system Phd/YefM family antitoxin [Gammaproteobacteria bacterium]
MYIITATQLKRDMKNIFEQSVGKQEPVIIKRPHGHDMAIIELSEYESLKETAYLLGNPANVAHLAKSMLQINTGKTVTKTLSALSTEDDAGNV